MSSLFPLTSVIDDEVVSYDEIHRNYSTFLSKAEKSVHSWFRLTPSFGPDLVKSLLREFEFSSESVILDPFCGAGTTLIEAQLLQVRAYGFEINPFLYFVGNTSLHWQFTDELLDKSYNELKCEYYSLKDKYKNLTCNELPYSIPPIHNVNRWWRDDILKDLLILKNAIKTTTNNNTNEIGNFFQLALAGVLVPDLTNVTLGKLQLHFIDKSNAIMDVEKSFFTHLKKMIDEIKMLKLNTKENLSKVFLTDSTKCENVHLNDKIDIVITSPPYPNRYSYVWNTRPFLYFFDFFDNAKQASDLDMKTIGGTWGTATSVLNKGIIEPVSDVLNENVRPITDKIRLEDNLMANYVMKYFNMLNFQIEKMIPFLKGSTNVAYVVGNSEIKGVFVETDVMLAKMFRSFGLEKTEINRFRKRNSGKNLFESIVYAHR
jgi:hypothetical protein